MNISQGNIVTCLFLILILNILSVYYTSINYKLKLCSSTDEDLKCKKTCLCEVPNKTDNSKVKNQVTGQVDESTIFEIKKDLIHRNDLNIGNLVLSDDKKLQFMFCKQEFTTNNNTDYNDFQDNFYIPTTSKVTCNLTTDLCCNNYVALTKTPGDRNEQFSKDSTNLVVPFHLTENDDIKFPHNYAEYNAVGDYINNLQLVHSNFSINSTNITNHTNFLTIQEPGRHNNTYNIIDDVFYMSTIVNSYIDKLNTSETKPVPICIDPSIRTKPDECKSDMYGFYKHENGENSRDPVNIYDDKHYNTFQAFITNSDPNSSKIKYYFCNSRMSFDTAVEKSKGSNGGNIIENKNLITESSQPINMVAVPEGEGGGQNFSYGGRYDNTTGNKENDKDGKSRSNGKARLLCSRFSNITAQKVYDDKFFQTYGFLK